MSEAIERDGWDLFEVEEEINDDFLLETAENYGVPFADSNNRLIQILKVKEKGSGIKNSFSFKFGFGTLQFHTDTAFFDLPSRFFLITSVFTSNSCTNIIDFNQILKKINEEELNLLKRAIFLMKIPEKQTFVKLFFNEKGKTGVRFDPNIMSPYNSSAKIALEIVNSKIATLEPIKIDWNSKKILIIDNWRCLHSRDNVEDKNRTLKRIYIK